MKNRLSQFVNFIAINVYMHDWDLLLNEFNLPYQLKEILIWPGGPD